MLRNFLFALSACTIFMVSFWGCVEKSEKQSQTEIRETQIDTLYAFTSFEEHNIAQPTDIRILNNGEIAVVDYSQKSINLLQSNGELITTFGREGKGPGEFVRIQEIFETNGTIIVVDTDQKTISRFNHQGDLIDSFTFQASSLLYDAIATIDDSLYTVGTGGDKNSLISITNINQDSTFYFGESKIESTESLDFLNSVTQLKNGEIPDFYKNMLTLRSDGTYLYAFLNSYSELHKYDLQGNLIWQKEVDLPYNEEIFNNTVEQAKSTAANVLPIFNFITDIKIIDQEIVILTGIRNSDDPQLLVRISETGEITDIVRLPGKMSYLNGFDINPKDNTAYFASSGDGVVYTSEVSFY